MRRRKRLYYLEYDQLGRAHIREREATDEEVEAARREVAERSVRIASLPTKRFGLQKWPILSDSLAVHPDDVPHAIEHAKQRGVPTEFCPKTGRPVIRSHYHQKEYCKAYGFADRSSSNRKKKD